MSVVPLGTLSCVSHVVPDARASPLMVPSLRRLPESVMKAVFTPSHCVLTVWPARTLPLRVLLPPGTMVNVPLPEPVIDSFPVITRNPLPATVDCVGGTSPDAPWMYSASPPATLNRPAPDVVIAPPALSKRPWRLNVPSTETRAPLPLEKAKVGVAVRMIDTSAPAATDNVPVFSKRPALPVCTPAPVICIVPWLRSGVGRLMAGPTCTTCPTGMQIGPAVGTALESQLDGVLQLPEGAENVVTPPTNPQSPVAAPLVAALATVTAGTATAATSNRAAQRRPHLPCRCTTVVPYPRRPSRGRTIESGRPTNVRRTGTIE